MGSVIRVEISEEKQAEIRELVSQIVEEKAKEAYHQRDNRKENKRFFTGLMGEAALEQLLGVDIIDKEAGNSKKYNFPDIPGYDVGIKTVEYGKYPLIRKENTYPQIFCVLDPRHNGVVYVCGLATVDVLNTFQDDNLILDPNLRKEGWKTGFCGFHNLQTVESILDIEKYRRH